MKSEYLKGLNPEQLKAVEHMFGPSMVIAGPGSGKTRVLTMRIAYLIEQGVAPWQILALTFTNKAAREMKERIESIVGERARLLWMGTFHSIFARMLRVEADKIGYPKDFTIYDTDDTKSVMREVIQMLKLDKTRYNVNAIRSRISSAKTNLISPKAYAQNAELLSQDKSLNRPYFFKIYQAYDNKLFRAGAMDFDDLLYRTYQLLQENKDGVKNKYQEQFQFIMVDEFQDTNYLQYAILRKFLDNPETPNNISVVGDDAQSIYSFRGATIDNILDFQKDYKNVAVYKLEQNYRSTPFIIDAANEVITYNKRQIEKKIWTEGSEGEKIRLVKAVSDTEEGRRIADMIVEQKHRHHLANRDIAILYRTNAQSRIFEEQLRKNNIIYKVFGGLSFYQRKEIKDIIAYLRLSINPYDDEALKRVINYPKRSIGKTTVDKILAHANVHGIPAWQAISQLKWSARTENALRGFMKMIAEMKNKTADSDAYEAAVFIAKRSGVYDVIRADTSVEGLNRLANINSLLDGIKEFVEDDEVDEDINEDRSLSGYLQNIALLTDLDNVDEQADYVSLMSIHSAKGLEYESVFLVGLEENLFPSFMAINEPNGVDEERRLFYVAITRAKKYLTLSHASSRYQHGQLRYNERSRFLDELPPKVMHDTSMAGGFIMDPGPSRSGISGNFKRLKRRATENRYADFKASSATDIFEGTDVLHQKFGKGKVLKLEGNGATSVATIRFEELTNNPDRRIMLKFAKLQVL